ncbi:MAG: GNAT family N-acetyltransferase [Tuberibacillus sp.]
MSAAYDEGDYIEDIRQKVSENPKGYVFMEVDEEITGQMELRIKEHEGQPVGYVSKYYLEEQYRGTGLSEKFMEYTENLFKSWNLKICHLRVAINNNRALGFYKKSGFTVLKEEENSYGVVCYRMEKIL